jgi:hypothetical protein
MIPFVHIELLNQSTVVTHAELAKMIPAFNAQLGRDLCPIWNLRPTFVTLVAAGTPPSATACWMTVFDTSDQPGALGYHDITTAGFPLGKAFAKTDLDAGLSLSCTLSHEICEMCCDPYIGTAIQAGDTFWAQEVCDAVEADADGYVIDGVLVSDFVTPRYFMPGTTGPYDFRSLLTQPTTLRPGGYMSMLTLKQSDGWTQIQAREGTQRHPATVPGSRRDLRSRGVELVRSTVATA